MHIFEIMLVYDVRDGDVMSQCRRLCPTRCQDIAIYALETVALSGNKLSLCQEEDVRRMLTVRVVCSLASSRVCPNSQRACAVIKF